MVREEDVIFADRLGVDSVGFVREPSSPRHVTLERAIELAGLLGPYVARCLVYRHCDEIPPRNFIVQAQTFSERVWESDVPKIQVLTSEPAVAFDRESLGSRISAILFDGAKGGVVGGSGQTCDWDYVARVRASIDLPVVLAGGLTTNNIQAAIQQVRPYAVDVSSGIESSPGVKDHDLMARFVELAQSVLLS